MTKAPRDAVVPAVSGQQPYAVYACYTCFAKQIKQITGEHMPQVDVGEVTYRALALAARLTGTTPGAVIDKLVAESDWPSRPAAAVMERTSRIRVYALYNGMRFEGSFDPVTSSIEIASGALAGSLHKSPSSAARAVIAHASPAVNTNRNGWTFWRLDDGTGAPLQTIRRSDRG